MFSNINNSIRLLRINNLDNTLISSFGKIKNPNFRDRDTKNFTIEGNYNTALEIIAAGTNWKIVDIIPYDGHSIIPEGSKILYDENDEIVAFEVEYDNSDYNILGDIIIHNNGTITMEYAKPNELDEANAVLDELVLATLSE